MPAIPDPTPDPPPPPLALDQVPVTDLQRVGPRIQERLARLGIHSVQDLLFHLPVRYEDRGRVVPLTDLRPGVEVQIEGEVGETQISYGRRRSLKVWLTDGAGAGDQPPTCGVLLRFFHFSPQQLAALRPGVRLSCYGEVREGPNSLELVHPEYRLCGADEAPPPVPRLTPIYPSTEGLQQSSWRGLTDQALALLAQRPPGECLPAAVLAGSALPDLGVALDYVHRPPLAASLADLTERRHPAFLRLAFEELVAHQVSLRRLRLAHLRTPAPVLAGDGGLRRRLREVLPFALTPDQEQAAAEIAADLARALPMQRLLQGDVGSGKTVVAALAALQAIESGRQAALMVPTELLSEQHYRGLATWLQPLGLAPVWLTGRHKGRERTAILAAIAAGRAPLVIGTHALIQEEVRFADLGLAIIDEQHRFGVHQRMRLREKGAQEGGAPHQLIMTATPIPRSLAMTLYADLDLSVIAKAPPGRTPIVTVALPDGRRDAVIGRVHDACAAGRQAYWVCTLIEESEALQAQAAQETARQLGDCLPGVRVGLVHGRQRAPEREAVMAAFAAAALDLLVATTVIEVGVDVPNASLMIIENPERLGLSQLHQLRGRVGRGARESHCVLLYHAPLTAQARDRLALIRATLDGFRIAEEDLKMRGAGEVLGTRQTGTLEFRVADPLRDQHLTGAAQRAADLILARHPDLVEPLIQRWLGRREAFGVV
ncbi:ATP-dependent DNA helicase RecG [uncultured Thiodictyon sp.]|jgi:ATP-dependent DNA helicase RecG|uniref:ATP-dependent DNA helicase RecG n=1 Tax=uncultured Thiodictyon sp. TaxID=1846217 RepID=UPI0025E0C67B|nr:ATP-dependent DNA helicase RecG [uncultured Thiodictyon sp.]